MKTAQKQIENLVEEMADRVAHQVTEATYDNYKAYVTHPGERMANSGIVAMDWCILIAAEGIDIPSLELTYWELCQIDNGADWISFL